MRELIVNTFLTLDGVMQAPGGPEEDPRGGFEHGGWSFGYWDEAMQNSMGELMGKPFDLLLGRHTYEIFAAYWPYSTEPGAEPLNRATKHVASHTLRDVSWESSKLLEGEVPEAVRALKQEDGPELQVHGSATLLQTLFAENLIDELRLFTFPLVLGEGKRLFGEGTHAEGFELTSSETSSTGVVMATYKPGAEIKGGSFASQEPSEAELERRAKLAG
jgi:dihydrofolate reductase